jgi:hypothetical protein
MYPQMTIKQVQAWAEMVEEAQRYVELEDIPTSHLHPYWAVRFEKEQRPGRGHDLSALWMSGDYAVSIVMDVYGSGSVSVGAVEMLHNSSDEECACEPCIGERSEDD